MADFAIQRGPATIADADTDVTITAGVGYTAPGSLGSSFIRIVGISSDSIGDADSDFNGQPQRNCVNISNPSNLLTSITFVRGASNGTIEFFYEIIEYTGAGGGDHEFIVRHEESIAFTATGTTLDSSTFGSVSTAADVCVFLTGMSNAGTNRADGGEGRFSWEYVSGSTLARGTRNITAVGGNTSIAAVEFTGSAWTVQRIDHAFSAAATTETETITSVGSLARAFIHCQSRYDTGLNGADGKGFEAWLSATTTLSLSADVIDSGQDVVTWIISNSQTSTGAMAVERIDGTRADNAGGGTDPDSWTESHSTGASDITTVSIMGECGESDKTTDQHLLGIGFEVNSTTVIDLKRGRDEGNRSYRFEVVSWPEEASGAFTLTAETAQYTYSGTSADLILAATFDAETAQYTYTGTAANTLFGAYISGETAQYAYTGTEADLTFEGVGAFTLVAETDQYNYTGTSADILRGASFDAETAQYTYSGTIAELNLGRTLTAETAQYTYSGTAAAIQAGRIMISDSGSYIITGTDATLTATGDVWTVEANTTTTWTNETDATTTWTQESNETTVWTVEGNQ